MSCHNTQLLNWTQTNKNSMNDIANFYWITWLNSCIEEPLDFYTCTGSGQPSVKDFFFVNLFRVSQFQWQSMASLSSYFMTWFLVHTFHSVLASNERMNEVKLSEWFVCLQTNDLEWFQANINKYPAEN